MATNFCPNCGAKIREGAKFCASCGQKISDASSPKIELQKSASPTSTQPTYTPPVNQASTQPTYTSPPQPTYTPPEDTTPHYKEDKTFQEMFLTSNGRLNRLRYFKRTLFLGAPALLLYAMSIGSAYHGSNAGFSGAFGLFLLYCLICFVPGVMLAVRRLHDLNLSGWYYLAFLIPVVGVLFSLYVLFAPGTVGPNKYGADPLENERVGR